MIKLAKRYIKQTWANRPSVASPINATRLNHIETGIDDCDNAIEEIYNTELPSKIDKSSIKTTDTVNDPNSPLGANVGYTHGQEIDTINNNLFVVSTSNPVAVSASAGVNTQITQSISLPAGKYIFFGRTGLTTPGTLYLCQDSISGIVWMQISSNLIIGTIDISASHNYFLAINVGTTTSFTADGNITKLTFVKLK